jgi:hypothetical protein
LDKQIEIIKMSINCILLDRSPSQSRQRYTDKSLKKLLERLTVIPIRHPNEHLPGITPFFLIPLPLLIIDLNIRLNLTLLGFKHPHE